LTRQGQPHIAGAIVPRFVLFLAGWGLAVTTQAQAQSASATTRGGAAFRRCNGPWHLLVHRAHRRAELSPRPQVLTVRSTVSTGDMVRCCVDKLESACDSGGRRPRCPGDVYVRVRVARFARRRSLSELLQPKYGAGRMSPVGLGFGATSLGAWNPYRRISW
jgi:hypothetical protein